MKELTLIRYMLFTFIIIFVVSGCSTMVGSLLRFQDRELIVHPDKSGLAYPHNKKVCKPRIIAGIRLGKKCKMKHVIDFYDLNKKEVREKLINAGFSCKSKMRFKY